LRRGGSRYRSLAVGFGAAGLDNVDAAPKHGAILDDDSRRGQVAFERAGFANFHLIAGAHVSTQVAENGDRARLNMGVDVAVGPNGQVVVLELDRPLELRSAGFDWRIT
jgi:hypothetical protein